MFKGIIFAILSAFFLVIGAIIYPLMGAFVGATAGYFFPATITQLISAVGLAGMAPWQFGFSLAFIGAFFRNTSK